MVNIKVFVGNLSFKTTEAELADAFRVQGGKVVNAHIITTPNNRSKGYGFVEFENKTDAEKAVAALNKKEIGGRPINVELARPQEEKPQETNKGEQTDRPARPPRRYSPRDNNNNNNTNTNNNNGDTRRPRIPREPRVPREPREQREQGTQGRRFNNNNNNEGGKQEVSEDGPRRNVIRRPRRVFPDKREEPEDRTPSKTMLFVANLAWKVNDELFINFLKTEGIKFKSANVVMTRNGRSRGYGFVNAENAEEQKRAMDILSKKELDGRQLNVKVANASSETPRAPATITTTTTPVPIENK